jgi:hypothetical protein
VKLLLLSWKTENPLKKLRLLGQLELLGLLEPHVHERQLRLQRLDGDP